MANFNSRNTECDPLLDSTMAKGATAQATYYDKEKKAVCSCYHGNVQPNVVHISGRNILSNTQVNVLSILMTSAIMTMMSPYFFQ